MSNTVIKVENLSKQYRLGQVSTGALSHDLNRLWYRIRGKEDPYLKIGEANDRTTTGSSDYVWALRDINFEVKHGEVLGIIGRNGAGKSTLLKILSRTTAPTTGSIKIKGRVASLLEVGTGFHPELSGRDNIFLNGAILGMTKSEIKRKFDEIVAFAGVERYIDTPVKRYSSGMYVRLAFAVAAHLEPEILIVDEVLAVGDAEFQKKALGKMQDVSSKDGRTVLFVSHNMLAVQNICSKALVLENGRVKAEGETSAVIHQYLKQKKSISSNRVFAVTETLPDAPFILREAIAGTGQQEFSTGEEIPITITFDCNYKQAFFLNFILRHISGDVVFEAPSPVYQLSSGTTAITFTIPAHFLNSGIYTVQLNFTSATVRILQTCFDVVEFEIEEKSLLENFYFKGAGYVRPLITTTLRTID